MKQRAGYPSGCGGGGGSLGQLHLLSQGDVKEAESCLSEALLTADLCVFSHLSCCVWESARARARWGLRRAGLHATGGALCRARAGEETLKDLACVATLHE